MCISQKHRILVGLLVLAATVILWTAASAASSGTCGDSLTWELDNSYMLTIRGTGAMTDYEIKAYTISGVVQYYYSTRPYQWNQAQKLVVEEGVTRIGKGAFYGCSNLTSAKLPDSLTSISDSSFAECSGLTGIRLPDSLKTIESGVFKKCSNLADIHLPANLDRIGQFVFCDCNALKKITIPDHCSEIGNGAFLDCRAVRYAAIGSSGAKALGKAKYSFTDAEHDVELKYQYDSDGKFTGELLLVSAPEHAAAVVIPASVTQIDECVFLNHTDLKKITIPDSVKKIGKYAFKGCTSLEEIILPDLLIAIGEYAFSECSGLSGVTVPKGVTDIADYAFSGCSSLASVTLPEGLYRIGNSAFKDCKNLKRITIPDGVTSVESESFSGCPAVLYAAIDSSAAKALGKRYYSFRTSGYDLDLWYYAGRSDLSVLSADNQAEIAIPAGVKSIHQKAFAD